MLNDDSRMTFGKHAGLPLKEVPSQYLLWLWDNVLHNSTSPKHQPLKEYVLVNYKAIIIDVPDYIPANPPV